MIRFENVTKRFGSRTVLDDVSYEIENVNGVFYKVIHLNYYRTFSSNVSKESSQMSGLANISHVMLIKI